MPREQDLPVVPHHHGSFLPLDPNLHIGTKRDVVVEEVEQVVALFLLESNDPTSLERHQYTLEAAIGQPTAREIHADFTRLLTMAGGWGSTHKLRVHEESLLACDWMRPHDLYDDH